MSNQEQVREWTEEHVRETLPKRDASSHKGTFGTALLLAGSDDMPGAALLSGLGAMRSGLGKLVIGTSESV
nr:NAD(P)H-hydrate dehydratase [Bacillus pacificus]